MHRTPKKPFVSDKLAKRRKAQAKARRIIVLLVTLIILAAAGYFIYANRFQIRGVTVVGSEAIPADAISLTADSIIGGKKLYVLPRRNIFLYSKKDVEAKLAAAYPRLETINAEITNKVLDITVTERNPAYLWCGENIPVTRQASFESTCYFVDASGYIFSLAPQFSDSVYIRIYTTLPTPEPIGQYAMTSSVLGRVATFAKQISSSTLVPSAYSITPDGDALIYLYRDGDTSPAIRYNPIHDPLTVVAQFKSAIGTEPLRTKLATSLATLEYIDVRFPNKIFYKFNDDIGQQQDNGKQ